MKSLLRLISLTGVAGFVLVLCSPLFYLLLETFPALINVLGLYRIDHLGMIQAFLPDESLVYRNRPPSYSRIFNLRAANYSAAYGIEVPLHSIRYHFDADGFRNAAMHNSSDVVVIGDSMVEYGDSENDILAAKLERLTGLSVTSLGVGGYGPFQYLEVWKRFGLSKNPKYALFCFYEENDLDDIHEYLRWKKEGRYYGLDILGASFWKRYRAAVKSTGRYLRAEIQRAIDEPAPAKTLPDVADLRMQNAHVQMLLMDKLSVEPIEKTLASEEWASLTQILSEFRDAARTHGVVPIIAYIPLAAHIYAEYSTPVSGENWLKSRDEQIAVAGNAERAMIRLARELHIDLIDLTPIFKAKAKAGRVLYYTYDQHWNSEGRETAAAVIAAELEKKQNAPWAGRSPKSVGDGAEEMRHPARIDPAAQRPVNIVQ